MTGIGTQIKNALGWFLTRLKGNVVNNLTSTSTDLPLSAAKGKDLQDQITSLNTNMDSEFRYYNSIAAIGLTNNASWDDILTALPRKFGIKFAAWKDSIPNLTSQAGARQEITVNKCESGYVTIEVWDIGSNVRYYCSHNGYNYTSWKSI